MFLPGSSTAFGKTLTQIARQSHSGPGSKNMSRLDSVQNVDAANVPLDRDVFLRNLIRELAGTLEEVLGINEASCFMSIVGQTLGDQIDHDYKRAIAVSNLTREQVIDLLVDLNRLIGSKFYVIEQDENKIVLANRACPFGNEVACPPSLCTITSNIFGVIVAENLGYAKVELQQTIGKRQPGCRVVVHLNPTPEAEAADGREYLKAA
jgi:predicted ArsR family transcriptional regulator